jgi:hypothetical protein
MLVGGPSLERSMSRYLIEQLAALPKVVVRTESSAVAAEGEDGRLRRLRVRDKDGAESVLDVDACFVFIGASPRTEWLDGVVARDERGFILSGLDAAGAGWPLKREPYLLETSVPSPHHPIGAKGVGESATVGSPAAFDNAVIEKCGADFDRVRHAHAIAFHQDVVGKIIFLVEPKVRCQIVRSLGQFVDFREGFVEGVGQRFGNDRRQVGARKRSVPINVSARRAHQGTFQESLHFVFKCNLVIGNRPKANEGQAGGECGARSKAELLCDAVGAIG